MVEVDALAPGGNGQAGGSKTRQDAPTTSRATCQGNTRQMVVKLGDVGSIPMKVPLEQAPISQKGSQPSSSKQQAPGQGSQPSRSRQQAPVAAADEPSRGKIYLSKESMAMVKEAVALGRLLPPDASRDELRAYNKLAGELT